MKNSTHKRYNPLSDEWVLVSPHRCQRPWQGQEEQSFDENRLKHDPDCYLCPGVTRAGGIQNPFYKSTYVFTNDFSALLMEPEEGSNNEDSSLFISKPESGICRVICFSPRHDLSIARMTPEQAGDVIDTWTNEYLELGQNDSIRYVQIFENRGEAMGCSNPHPHGQIWATQSIPTLPECEQNQQIRYKDQHLSCLLCDYLGLEIEKNERIIFTNASFVIVVPYWAVWPFETLIIPRRHMGSIAELSEKEKNDLSEALILMGIKFDNLFSTSFPYSMGIHQQPTDGLPHPEWHFHIHYYPPLLRSATIKKFMVGFEMLAMPQRDLTAEESAQMLRACSDQHYMGVQ